MMHAYLTVAFIGMCVSGEWHQPSSMYMVDLGLSGQWAIL